MKLDIGSGGAGIGNGYVGVDPFVAEAPIKAFMWDLPFEDNTVEAIYSSHALEHISKFQVVPTLAEWYRVLEPGGKLELLIPDLEWCVKYWLLHQGVGWELDIIFGHQAHEGEYHKTGFTPAIITEYLSAVRFVIDSIEYISTHSQQTIRVLAHK